MEQERPASRGSSIFSDETIDAQRPPSRALSVSSDLSDAIDLALDLVNADDELLELELDWLEPNNELDNVIEWLDGVEALPQIAEVDRVQEPDSSSDWVAEVPAPPLEDYSGPADSTSWLNN
jgi:hypothetical protein